MLTLTLTKLTFTDTDSQIYNMIHTDTHAHSDTEITLTPP